MDLPDCPPGAEGYEDSVTEVPKKPEIGESTCTKAEKEFQEHLNSLKIKTQDGSFRSMVERRGRDVSGKWIYLCFPCAAVCSGESVLQTHISGKRHKTKLSLRTVWPLNIFEEHPYVMTEKGISKCLPSEVEKPLLEKMAEEVEIHNRDASDLESQYGKLRQYRCHLQDALDDIKVALVGVEYLIEHPPQEEHHEPAYICTLCSKKGHPRTIINHLTCHWHKLRYLACHFTKANNLLCPYRYNNKYREGVLLVVNRLTRAIEDKYGRMKPVNIDKHEYERDREQIHQWIVKGPHFEETPDCTFAEVVDDDLIVSLQGNESGKPTANNRDPSPPVVTAPTKPRNSAAARRAHQRVSAGSLSDVSDEPEPRAPPYEPRYEAGAERRREAGLARSGSSRASSPNNRRKQRQPNHQYKLKLAKDQLKSLEDSAKKSLAYHEKNPEKHPLYPEEWKKFWNRRYKEIQADGDDPSKHDFKPEWIDYWMKRMKELHEDELRANMSEIYRKLCITPPAEKPPGDERQDDARDGRFDRNYRDERDARIRVESPGRDQYKRRRPPGRVHSPDRYRRSPEYRRSPDRRRSPCLRRISPRNTKYCIDRRVGIRDVTRPAERRSPPRRASPLKRRRTHSRSPPPHRSGSPLSKRVPPRNRSLGREPNTVLISDDELKPDDGPSPWNSDSDSMGSLPDARSMTGRSRGTSVTSRTSRLPDAGTESRHETDFGSVDNIVATLRLLVALEDYLGSLGPKVVDLLGEAIKMEKEKANSSEELLERDSAVVLIETAKEKLKGAAQAGLVTGSAAAAVRAAVVRAAATLHEADRRAARRKQQEIDSASTTKATAVPIAGVGEVNREQIARQMAAALIAQGKTDVSSEELAQLVEAVVGMAEAKKREAQSKQELPRVMKASGSATSALQLLQSAYDDKKVDQDAPDAMDGLSDSDLETLLKNFNELSAEEQHSLIAYLKKLEAREPQRVERLRQYVSSAAANAPPLHEAKRPEVAPVAIESDDDDYTVEDVFKSATQKVKEDQIRQEMEIVKKSLEESKVTLTESLIDNDQINPVPVNISSATGLLALVQASLKSASAPTSTSQVDQSNVVSTDTQPRSYGDLPENNISNALNKPLLPNPHIPSNPHMISNHRIAPNLQMPPRQQGAPQGLLRTPPIQANVGTNWNNRTEILNPQSSWEPKLSADKGQGNISGYDDTYNGARVPDAENHGQRGVQNNYNQAPWSRTDNHPVQRHETFQGMRTNNDNFQRPRGNFPTCNTIQDDFAYQQDPRPQDSYNDQSQFSNQSYGKHQFSNQPPHGNRQFNNQNQYGMQQQFAKNDSFRGWGGRGGRGHSRGRGRGYY